VVSAISAISESTIGLSSAENLQGSAFANPSSPEAFP
jgi:hypothetical protein